MKRKNKIVVLLLVLQCISINILGFSTSDSRLSSNYYSEKFKVRKIESRKKINIIYAERNDTIYKILTERVNVKCSQCEKIHKNGEYYFSLRTLFPRYSMGISLLPPGTTGRMGTVFNGVIVNLETEKNIWDIFEATNLRGLYIIEELDQSHIELFDKPFE